MRKKGLISQNLGLFHIYLHANRRRTNHFCDITCNATCLRTFQRRNKATFNFDKSNKLLTGKLDKLQIKKRTIVRYSAKTFTTNFAVISGYTLATSV